MFGLDLSALQEKTKNIQEHYINMEVFMNTPVVFL
jgi:hypothetical protein